MGWGLLALLAADGVFVAGRGQAATQEQGAPTEPESTTRAIFGALPGVFNVIDTPASEMDWTTVRHFTRSEFVSAPVAGAEPIDCTPYLAAATVRAADNLRGRYGRRLMVSPAPGAIVRTYGNPDSDHYVGELDGSRLSEAIDLMDPAGGLVGLARIAESMDEITGFGAYPDWDPHPGVHIGTGNDTGRWMAVDGEHGQRYLALDFARIRRHLGDRLA